MVFSWRPAVSGPSISSEPAAEWMAHRACTDEDADLFHPAGEEFPPGAAEPAKAICRRCPVRARCLAFGVAAGDRWGVYGGLTYQERKYIKRSRDQWAAEMAVA